MISLLMLSICARISSLLLHSEGDFANFKGVIFLCFVNESHKNRDFVLKFNAFGEISFNMT
jgi:hypothetical protein